MDPKQYESELEFITIKIDDRTFRTYRRTLTQVDGSKIAKLFNGKYQEKQLLRYDEKSKVYYMNSNPDIFGQVLEVLRTKGSAQIKMSSPLYAALLEFGVAKKFYSSMNPDTLKMGTYKKSLSGYHVVFASYRSTSLAGSYYPLS